MKAAAVLTGAPSAVGQAARAVAFAASTAWGVYHPAAGPVLQTPAGLGLEFEDWAWTTRRDRVRIEGWFVPGRGPHAVLVQHGVGRSRAEVLTQVAALHAAGYHVLATDMRNHGSSGRCRSVVGMAGRYTSDLVDALARVADDPRVTGRLGCLGMSFSTWPTISAAALARAEGLGLRAVVCDSGPVVDIGVAIRRLADALVLREDALTDALARRLATGLTPILAAGLLAVRGWPRTGCALPVLLVTGGRDRLLPSAEVLAMLPHLARGESWTVPRAGHLRAIDVDPEGYRRHVVGFFDQHLAGGPVQATGGAA